MMIHRLFFAWFALFFCRFGGDSSSSSSNQTTTTNVDKRQVVDGQGLGVSSDSSTVNVSQLDGGAIDSAFNFASSGLDSAARMMLETMKRQSETEKAALTFASNVNDGAMRFAFDAGKPDASLVQNFGKYLSLAGGILGLALLWMKSK